MVLIGISFLFFLVCFLLTFSETFADTQNNLISKNFVKNFYSNNTLNNLSLKTVLGKGIKSVTTSFYHTCAINNNKLFCWGANWHGGLGDNTTEHRNIPTPVLTNVNGVAAGDEYTCAINNKNELYCWGRNDNGQLGDNTTKEKYIPALILNNVKSVTAGSYHTCAINSENKLYCWGKNDCGQLGDNTTKQKKSPTLILNNVKSVAVGLYHTCAIDNEDKLYCWGKNEDGELGDNTTEDRGTPTLILNNVKSVTAGLYHTCVINNEDKFYCWGSNSYGKLGNGTNVDTLAPILISDDAVNDCSGDPNYLLIDSECIIGVGECSAAGKYYCDASDDKVKCDAVLADGCYEECNGLDDNKNGLIDEGYNIGGSCTVGVGVCERVGEYICSESNNSSICSGTAGEAGIETCDNIGTDDNCDGVIHNGVIFFDEQCYDKNDIINFEECDPSDVAVVNNYCYKISDYYKENNIFNGNAKPLPPVVAQVTSQGKIEILMEKYKIGATLKKKLQKKVFKKYGLEKAKLKIIYKYVVKRIKGSNAKIVKKSSRNEAVKNRMNAGNYKIQYRVVIQTIVNKKPVILQSSKFSNAVKFAITRK